MVLQGGLTLVAKPSTQSASVLRLYTKGVQVAETENPKSNNMWSSIDVTINVDNMAHLWTRETRHLQRRGLVRYSTLEKQNDD